MESFLPLTDDSSMHIHLHGRQHIKLKSQTAWNLTTCVEIVLVFVLTIWNLLRI